MRNLKQSTARTIAVFMTDSGDHISGKTGLGSALTVQLGKNGAAKATITPTSVTEDADGWYLVALSTTHTNTLGDAAFHVTATGADPSDWIDQVVAYDFEDGVRLGLTALPNAAAEAAGGLYTQGTGAGQIRQDANGRVDVNVKAFRDTAAPSPTTAGIPVVEDAIARTAIGLVASSVANIAATSAALNSLFASRTITTGSGSGGVANTSGVDQVYDDVSDTAGAIDFYYEADFSAVTGAIAVGVQWTGYVVGAANTVKVYARNWVGAVWDQIGEIVGSATAVEQVQEWALTNAHTEVAPGKLVRVRFAATGLTSATVKTDRILAGYTIAGTVDANVVSIDDAAAQAIIDGPGALVEGSNTLADAIRGITSSVGGPVTDFRTGTLVFKSLDGSKTRWTVTLDSSGRIAVVQGDLT